MTMAEIVNWCASKTYEKARHEFDNSGKFSRHKVRFEDGEIYEHTEEFIDSNNKRVTVKINGQEVFDGLYSFENFGWKAIKE